MSFEQTVEVGGKKIQFSTGEIAKQADGAVTVSCGETVVFASAVVAHSPKEGQDFFPLSVEYREKYYAAGRFPRRLYKTRRETRRSRSSRLPNYRPSSSSSFPQGFCE